MISFGPRIEDDMHNRLVAACDHFIEVSEKSDYEIAELSRELEIDIAVDLKGFTTDARTGIFAYRAAPIQVNYLGYPGTMGASYFDYVIADRVLVPQEMRGDYMEKVVCLPNSYQVNDRKRVISSKVFSRVELGLPENGFVFCCFNNSYKILPATFGSWARILQAVEGSVLWLLEDTPLATSNLKQEVQKRGLDPSRLVFAKRTTMSEHLARHSVADLFIDTFPYNAHTTTSDSLWAGLPVLTRIGETFPSRVAASLLSAVGLPELIAKNQEEYEGLAIALANDRTRLMNIKQALLTQRANAALFDTPRFTKDIEAAYLLMMDRYCKGLAPDHIDIDF